MTEAARTPGVVCAGWSYFQKPLTPAYPYRTGIFRGGFGVNFVDPNFLVNAAAAKHLYAAGDADGWTVFFVPIVAPGSQYTGTVQEHFDFIKHVLGDPCPDWVAAIQLDWEVWDNAPSYRQHGDHSRFSNHLAALVEAWAGRKVTLYANKGDLAELLPHRDPKYPVEVAHYASDIIVGQVPGAIAQQYTDGELKYPVPAGLPRSTQPFGPCDHTIFTGYRTAKDVCDFLRGDSTPTPHRPGPLHRRLHRLLARMARIEARLAKVRLRKGAVGQRIANTRKQIAKGGQ